MKKRIQISITDFYYKHPLLIDAVLSILVLFAIYRNKKYFKFVGIESNIDNILSSVIDTNVSFSGFILACLTIIVSFKANIKVKHVREAENALELLLLSKNNYKKIVSAFRDAIVELVFALSLQYIFWLPIFGLKASHLVFVSLFGIQIIFFTLIRTLYLLFRIVFQEFKSDEDA